VRAGGDLVGVGEERVDGGVCMLARLLAGAQPKHAGLEVDVGGGVAGDQRDVMEAADGAQGLILSGRPAEAGRPVR